MLYILSKYIEILETNKEKILKKQEELRKDLKYGYKIVYAPVLVKLSFPENAEVINLDLNQSKANYAYVESAQLIGKDIIDIDSVTNFRFRSLTYKVGENVYSKGFDYDVCGPGIHFVTNIEDLVPVANISYDELNIIKQLNK